MYDACGVDDLNDAVEVYDMATFKGNPDVAVLFAPTI
jgi:hypothetical protein